MIAPAGVSVGKVNVLDTVRAVAIVLAGGFTLAACSSGTPATSGVVASQAAQSGSGTPATSGAVASQAAQNGSGTDCGAFVGTAEYKLVVKGKISCADASKVMVAYLQQGAANNRDGVHVKVDDWSCIFDQDPTSAVAHLNGFSCMRDGDVIQLVVDPTVADVDPTVADDAGRMTHE
ncbi:hypothetical protein [Frankia sp. Cr1]|uniref:hypothetical protein n=1 Tax=Frankia sp. Cr1 TaxID=3073931 RepID=UPI002AD37D17|nr:hypothetical protein [Frankia sp. Cr1]